MMDNQPQTIERQPYGEYRKHYSDEGFRSKLKRSAASIGIKAAYLGLLLYYALKSPKTPKTAKIQIYGALGYLILPLDIMPDILPAIGYVDDWGALLLALGHVAGSINDEVRQQAKNKLRQLFRGTEDDHPEVVEVERRIQAPAARGV